MLPKRRLRMKVRATPEKGEGTGEAVVSTYDLEYEVGFGWTEKIIPGCFDASITDHPTIPIYHQHNWDDGPIGSGQPTEADDQLTVAFALYLGQGDLVGRVYQAMLDKALEEWSIGFWAEEITWDKGDPMCDQISLGDLAEASICVRGANPETGTLELNGRAGWIDGDEEVRKKEVARLRSRYNVADLGKLKPTKRAPDPDEPDLTGGVPTIGEQKDPAEEESARARAWDLLSSSLGRERLAAQRSSQPAPSLP